MRFRSYEYDQAYRQIKELSFKCGVLVFASAREADALCATKILTSILRLDSVAFSVVPVNSADQLITLAKKHLGADDEDPDPRAIIMLNCGGTEDVLSELLPPLHPDSRVLLIESHRPLALDNVDTSNRQVMVLQDDEEDFPQKMPDVGLAGLSQASDGGVGVAWDDTEDTEETEEQEGGRRRLSEHGDYEAGRRGASQSQRRGQATQDADYQLEILSYYRRGHHFGRAAGQLVYDLAQQLGVQTPEHLWYAIVALTDQHVHMRLAREAYAASAQALEACLEHIPSTTALADGTVVPVAADSHIRSKEEFCFYHLRHWNLADAMMHAPYVATTLKTWEEKGAKKLQRLFARMGVPLAACRQKYTHMSRDLVDQLETKLEEFGREVGLHELRFTSFYTERGHKLTLSASDVALGVSALLEGPVGEGNDWTDNWRAAIAALSPNCWPELRAGIGTSIAHQRTIFAQAGLLLAKGAMMSAGPRLFKYCNMADSAAAADAAVLQNPLVLARLALFLQEEVSAGKQRRRPMVVLAPETPEKDADGYGFVRIVGVSGRPNLTDTTFNQLSHSFNEAVQNSDAVFKYPTFNPSIIDIRSDHVKSFMEELREVEWNRVSKSHQQAV